MDWFKSPRNIVLALITVVVVAAAAFVFVNKKGQGPKPPTYAYTQAAPGKVVAGFPPELVLDDKAKLASSYSLNYNANLNQYTALFASEQTMLGLFSAYRDYFKKNNWTVTNVIQKYPTSRGIYATKGTIEVSVAIMDQGKSRQVTVSYVVK